MTNGEHIEAIIRREYAHADGRTTDRYIEFCVLVEFALCEEVLFGRLDRESKERILAIRDNLWRQLEAEKVAA